MSADQRCHSSILGKLAAPPRCWCCERPFGESGVVQLPAYREWLAYQCDSDIPPAGICEECASERNACLRCGRVPGLEADGNPYLQTWELKDSDEERLQAAGLEELTAYCEPCLVRDYLMDDEFMEDSLAGKKSNLPKNVAFGLAMIIARHWGKSLYVKEQGLPIPGGKVGRIEQLAAIICNTTINRPATLAHVVANEAFDPTFRRALGMLEETCVGNEDSMSPLLKRWVKLRDVNKLPKQRSNKPVDKHANRVIASILLFICRQTWVCRSGMKATRQLSTHPMKACSICDAVVQGLGEAGVTREYSAVSQVWKRGPVRVVSDTDAPSASAVRELGAPSLASSTVPGLPGTVIIDKLTKGLIPLNPV